MKLRLLSQTDHQALLAFEIENRCWFETHIAPRDSSFYCLEGVKKHIEQFLSLHERGRMMPLLMIDEVGNIVGRINISEINSVPGFACLGYRVGEHFGNRGYAKQAVSQAVTLAQKLQIHTLIAYASVENTASQKVLQHNDFNVKRICKAFTEVRGERQDCIEYRRGISGQN